MAASLGRRLGAYGALVVVLAVVAFVLPRALPGDPLSAMTTPGSASFVTDAGAREQLRAFYGLDRRLGEQAAAYVGGLASGDWGSSLRFRRPVAELIIERLPRTALLTGVALSLGTLLGALIGAGAGYVAGGRRDLGVVIGVVAVRSVPVFVVASVLQLVLGVRLGWFPVFGADSGFGATGPLDLAWHLTLPAVSLALAVAAGQVLAMRGAVIATRDEAFVRAARARGVGPARVRRHHVRRNAWVPVLGVIGAQAGVAFASATLVEAVFAYPGLGSLLVDAIEYRDHPLLQGCCLTMGVVAVACLALSDVARVWIDPRTATA